MRGKLAALGFVYLLVMAAVGGPMQQAQFVAFEAEGVLAAEPAQALTLRIGTQALALQRTAEGWNVEGKALPPALLPRVNLAVKFLHTAKPVRVLEGADLHDLDFAALGFDDQSLSVSVQIDRTERTLSFGKPMTGAVRQAFVATSSARSAIAIACARKRLFSRRRIGICTRIHFA
jgi:hypothetical protein